MKHILLTLLLLSSPVQAQVEWSQKQADDAAAGLTVWTECSHIGVPYYAATYNKVGPLNDTPAIYMNALVGEAMQWRSETWNVVDGAPFNIPKDTIAVHVTGILIITNGGAEIATPDLHLRLRRHLAPDNEYKPPYPFQSASPFGGSRTNIGGWVAVSDQKFDMYWTRSTQGDWPTHASYGISIWIDAYCR